MKIIRKGYVQSMAGLDNLINTKTDEMVTVSFKKENRKQQVEMYCKYVKVTIEEITEKEFLKNKPE